MKQMHFIKRGRVSLSRSDDSGHRVVRRILSHSGDAIGLSSVEHALAQESKSGSNDAMQAFGIVFALETAEAATYVEVVSLDLWNLSRLLARDAARSTERQKTWYKQTATQISLNFCKKMINTRKSRQSGTRDTQGLSSPGWSSIRRHSPCAQSPEHSPGRYNTAQQEAPKVTQLRALPVSESSSRPPSTLRDRTARIEENGNVHGVGRSRNEARAVLAGVEALRERRHAQRV